jgi:hypothetical protein
LFLLNQVYKTVIIPFEVANELKNLNTFGFDANEIFSNQWIEVKQTFSTQKFYNKQIGVHLGEAAAISLALELNVQYILIDDRKGQLEALNQNLLPIGTLGTLKLAKENGVIVAVKDILDEIISSSNYWLNEKYIQNFFKAVMSIEHSKILPFYNSLTFTIFVFIMI